MATQYAIARGWFKGHLHATYGPVWYKRMMRAKRSQLRR